jgi:hypothetical protein
MTTYCVVEILGGAVYSPYWVRVPMLGVSHVTVGLAAFLTVAMKVVDWPPLSVVDVGVSVMETGADVQQVRVVSVVVFETPLPAPLAHVISGVYVYVNPPPHPLLAVIQSVTVPVRVAASHPDCWSHPPRQLGVLGI